MQSIRNFKVNRSSAGSGKTYILSLNFIAIALIGSVKYSTEYYRKILSITFTVTKDLDACFPASIARKCFGLDSVSFLDCQQMYVPNDINFCIRLMALVIFPSGSTVNHPYLRGAANLRSDRC